MVEDEIFLEDFLEIYLETVLSYMSEKRIWVGEAPKMAENT